MSSRFIAPCLVLGPLLTVIILSGTPAAMAQSSTPAAPAAQATPAPDPEKRKAIRTLLEVSGAIRVMEDVIGTMTEQMGAMNPNIPAEFLKRFKARVKVEEIVTRIIPVYDKHFTREEINQMIIFYQSPLGKKMTASQLSIQRESAAIGQKYGEEIGMQIVREMEKEGKLPKSNGPDR